MTTLFKKFRKFIDIEVEGSNYFLSISNLNEHSKTAITLNRDQLTVVRDEITKYLDATKPVVTGAEMIGKQVLTMAENGDQHWTYDVRRARKWGFRGKIVSHHNSHGECYGVQHEDGTQAFYNPGELELI